MRKLAMLRKRRMTKMKKTYAAVVAVETTTGKTKGVTNDEKSKSHIIKKCIRIQGIPDFKLIFLKTNQLSFVKILTYQKQSGGDCIVAVRLETKSSKCLKKKSFRQNIVFPTCGNNILDAAFCQNLHLSADFDNFFYIYLKANRPWSHLSIPRKPRYSNKTINQELYNFLKCWLCCYKRASCWKTGPGNLWHQHQKIERIVHKVSWQNVWFYMIWVFKHLKGLKTSACLPEVLTNDTKQSSLRCEQVIMLSEFFHSVFSPKTNFSLKDFQVQEPSLTNYDISKNIIRKIIDSIDATKSRGQSGIPPGDYVKTGKNLCNIMHSVLRNIKRLQKIPDSWKVAAVTPIFKKRERRKFENERPVSILNIDSKILEKMYIHCIVQSFSKVPY